MLSRRILCWFVVGWLLIVGEARAQHYIQLTKQSTGRSRTFDTGDRIRYRLKHPLSRKIERGRIEVITDTGIWVNNHHILIDSLSYIGEGGLGLRIALGAASVTAGALLITHIGEQNDYGIVQYVLGQILVGLGTLEMAINGVKLFTTTRYDLNGKWSIRIRRYRNDSG